MDLGRKLLGHSHHHDHDAGGVIVRPRLYELVAEVSFLGLRPRVFDHLVARSGADRADDVLDIGCGTGYFAGRIAKAVGTRSRIVGIDPSEPMVTYANHDAPPNCSFIVAPAENLPFPDGSFDLIVSSLAIHHIPVDHRPTAFSEMLRVLRPGGRLFVAEFRAPRSQAVNRLIGLFAGHAMQHDHMVDVEHLAAAAGFHIDESGEQRPFLRYTIADKPR
jgi:ubiquinone/menaquinone biosynthesis C-methylase UbiE